VGRRTAGPEQLRSAAALLDALDLGVLALDGRGKPVALNRKAQDLLACRPDGSRLPRPLLDLVDEVWRGDRVCTRELLIGGVVVRLHASRLEDSVLVQVQDVSLLRHLQQAHRTLVSAITERLLERVEGPALLVEALASVDDPVLATRWLHRLRGDVADLARLVGDEGERSNGSAPRSPATAQERPPQAFAPAGPGTHAGAGRGGARRTLLLVEPVDVVADAMTVGLSNAGFDTVATRDLHAALEVVKVAEPDCVLLDIGQDCDVAATRRLREATSVPMLLVAGRDAEPRLPREVASDPAVVVLRRPLRLRELAATAMRMVTAAPAGHVEERADGVLEAGDVILDTRAHTVSVRGRRVPMSLKERQLLRALLSHPGRMLPYERLLELAWGEDISGASLGTYLRRLRRKIERDPSRPQLIITIKGVGVRFEAPRTRQDDHSVTGP
jgi:two-component system response regulator RegX3